MQNISSRYLKRKRTALSKKLTQIASLTLRGSLIETYKRCGKSRCKCAKGQGHGPKYYLSISQSGAFPKTKYISLKDKEIVQQYVQNTQEVRRILEQINEINQELLQRREL